ncbi:MAG: RT0821/Lpp0805 family surface protein [Proteobacteria bacterium]|nr:RT0821/Lpp0805 family surface protein [Pseudomonadota bacterium]
MLTYTRNTLFGLAGISLVTLAAAPAHADGWKRHQRHDGPRVVKVVKKVVYVQPRESRARYRRDRRWIHRPVRTRVVHHHHTRVVHRNTVVTQPTYRRGNNAVAGSVIGAVLGGLTGNAIVRGRGRGPAILVGGVLGAIIGGSIGDSMDRADRLHTHNALETAKSGQRVTWTNPGTGADYTVTPTRTYQRENGQYCRDFKSWGWIDGYEEELHGTACRASDGTWRKAS